ncbi:PAS domain-containing protein [Denitrobaculum tricleocarpae]|uniref:PAS domain-containing protein n=1 Tax=Denitrobaculum tricleocarpae TaxID=2591009 RepID=A0A545TXJ8_9PROT|nr:PAS domain-containing protein [Denitrobaculum tricleocarpae]TQV81952.1 PAS domain-containing protein [Denitrobaculum tricleocarpae]
MNPMNEELLQSDAGGESRPAGSLTSGMIRRRKPVRVATPEDMGGPRTEAPAQGAQELTARVEAAFSEDSAGAAGQEAQSGSSPQSAPEAPAAPNQDEALHARQQELRRLAAERAEAQKRPLQVPGASEAPGSDAASSAPPRSHENGTAVTGPTAETPAGQPPQAFEAPQQPVSPDQAAHAARNIDDLHQAPVSAPAGTKRKSLVQGGMTPLERRRAAQEHQKKLAEAQERAAHAKPRDVASYWDELRRGRQVPSVIDIDPSEVAQHWPNSLMINCNDISDHATVERSFAEVMRGAREQAAAQGDVLIEYTPMVTEWIMTVGREVARAGRPIQDIEVFPTSVGNVSYRVIALPLSGERLGDVHALCHITHA